MKKPKLLIIGGANGSGKTTLAFDIIAVENLVYLGADEIARKLNPKNLQEVAVKASRIFSKTFDEYLEKRESFLVESTLSGLSLKKKIEKARLKNYEIQILFIYLDSPELCIQRVAARVAKGGHNVAENDIRRRFYRANSNFWHVYKNLADEWSLFYNSIEGFSQVALSDDENVIILDEKRFQTWLKMN